MAITHIIVNRNTGKQVGTLDTDTATVSVTAPGDSAIEYLPEGDVSIFTGAPPSADTALVDEREETPATKTATVRRVGDQLAGTPLALQEK